MIKTLHPVHTDMIQKKWRMRYVPEFANELTCWYCGKKGHRVTECRFSLNFANIAACKAALYDKNKKRSKEFNVKRALHELVMRINNLFKVNDYTVDDDDPSTVSHTFKPQNP